MTCKEVISDAVSNYGIACVLKALMPSFEELKSAHKYRKDFSNTAIGLLGVLVERLEQFESDYGYVPGKDTDDDEDDSDC